jgi:dolichol-phosphate mannosyltransferase
MSLALSVLMPCYNESRTLIPMIERVADQAPLVAQIVVVNDGSTDDTRVVLDYLKDNWKVPHVALTIKHLVKNRGKGAAVREALELAQKPYILIQDADLELDPSDYAELIKPIERNKANAVFGDRFAYGFPQKVLLASKLANWIVTTLSNILFGLKLKDQACGYKLMPTAVCKAMQLESDGFEICSEMTAKLGLMDVVIASVPVRYNPRGLTEGKKIRWHDGFIAVYTLFKYRSPWSWRPS